MATTLLEAHDELYAAINRMLHGDAGPLCALVSDAPDAMFAGPFGGIDAGAESVRANYEAQAARKLGGEVNVCDLHVIDGTDMGVTVCVEYGTGLVIDGKPGSLRHRATNIFRREADGWKLVHHHTDLAS